MLRPLQDKEILPCRCVENLTELQYEKRLLNFPESEEMVRGGEMDPHLGKCVHAFTTRFDGELVKKGFNLIVTQNKPHSRIHTILWTECLCFRPDARVYPLCQHPWCNSPREAMGPWSPIHEAGDMRGWMHETQEKDSVFHPLLMWR